jgi:hypothetical protein
MHAADPGEGAGGTGRGVPEIQGLREGKWGFHYGINYTPPPLPEGRTSGEGGKPQHPVGPPPGAREGISTTTGTAALFA